MFLDELRETKPHCIEYSDGMRRWLLGYKLHRSDGPAVEYPDGSKFWYQNGQLHRTDGPAIESICGYHGWYLFGERYEDLEVWKITSEMLILLFPGFGSEE